jgi:hypothetical protein
MRPPVRVITSEDEYVDFLGHYEVTELFIPNSWTCPDRPIAHSLDDGEVDEELAICGEKWIAVPNLIEATGMEVAICLECIRLYEKRHYGQEPIRRPELGAI